MTFMSEGKDNKEERVKKTSSRRRGDCRGEGKSG